MNLVKNSILNVGITNEKEENILKYVLEAVKKSKEKFFIVTPNPEILIYAYHHESFKNILSEAKIALCDGVGLVLAGKFLGKSFKARTTGADFMENLCKRVNDQPVTVGFLGGRDRVAELTAECLSRKYPKLKVAFAGEEWPNFRKVSKDIKVSEVSKGDSPSDTFDTSKPFDTPIDILFVAYGFPKQEEWIYNNLSKIPVTMAMAVGGSFDYISGKVPRAPVFIRNLGLEWLFRLIVQPWRIKRQLALIEFIWLVLAEKFNL